MKVRRKARIVALQTLYEVDLAAHQPGQVLQRHFQKASLPHHGERFASHLVAGVVENGSELDDLIAHFAPEWPLDQMSAIDRNILRIAIFEFWLNGDTPIKVAINEAVELSKLFGSESSARFVNGVLGSLAASRKTAAMKDTRQSRVEGR